MWAVVRDGSKSGAFHVCTGFSDRSGWAEARCGWRGLAGLLVRAPSAAEVESVLGIGQCSACRRARIGLATAEGWAGSVPTVIRHSDVIRRLDHGC